MKTRAVKVTIHIGEPEGYVGKRVSSVYNTRDPPLAREFAYLFDRKYLSRRENHVRHMDNASARSNSIFVKANQIARIIYRDGEIKLLEHDLFPPSALLPRKDHSGVVLTGSQDLVAGYEV